MNRLWPIIGPILQELGPRTIVEVGAAEGANTANLLRHARDNAGVVHVIDIERRFDEEELAQRCGGELVCHWGTGLEMLPEIAPNADAILLDGDHNWFCAHSELTLIDRLAPAGEFPLVLLHDVGWPYGRRDGYRASDSVPPEHSRPHDRRGIVPGDPGALADGGLLAENLNALTEGGPRNGVRTAVDDFLAETKRDLGYAEIPGFHGLGVLCERRVLTGPLAWVRDLAEDRRVAPQLSALEWARIEALRIGQDQSRRAERGEAALAERRQEEALEPWMDERSSRIAMLEASLADRARRIGELHSAVVEREADLFVIEAGRSWRITKPLRRIARSGRAVRDRWSDRAVHRGRVGVPLASVQWSEVATTEPAQRPVRWAEPLSIRGDRRVALEQHLPSRIAYRMHIPDGCVFSAHVALRPEAWLSGGVAVRCAISGMTTDGRRLGETTLHLDPHRVHRHRQWMRMTLELPPVPDEGIIVLETQPGDDAAHDIMVCWGDPILYVPVTGAAEAAAAPINGRLPAPAAEEAADPLISVLLPVHDPSPAFLRQAIQSVRAQTYPRWQLCIVDDASQDSRISELLRDEAGRDRRVTHVRRARCGGISAATNVALELARGDFVALLDHDDELAHDALEHVVEHLRAAPQTDVVYTDEDRILEDGTHFGGVLKPDWSPELLRGGMYTSHLGVYRRELIERLEGFRGEYDGAQDYDLMLRATEHTQRIGHVPRVLYHWRTHDSSVAINPAAKPYAYEAARRALEDHLERSGIEGSAERTDYWGLYRTRHRSSPAEHVSVVVPFENGAGRRDALDSLRRCLTTVMTRAGHNAWELVCVTGDEHADQCEAAIERFGNGHVRLVRAGAAPGRTALLRAGAENARGGHLVLFSDLCLGRSAGWLAELVGYSCQDQIGVVGAKVVSQTGTIVHAGVVIGEGLPLPAYRGVTADYVGHMGRLAVAGNCTAVDGVVMTRRSLYEDLGGLSDGDLTLAIVDYCLRAREHGLRNVFAPQAELALADPVRAAGPVPVDELARFKHRWAARLPDDPYYHPDFCQVRASFPAPPASDG